MIRTLDALVAERVMQWFLDEATGEWMSNPDFPRCEGVVDHGVEYCDLQVFSPSSSWADAGCVMQKIQERDMGREFAAELVPVMTKFEEGCDCDDGMGACAKCWFAVANASPLQRCLAALRAVGVTAEEIEAARKEDA